MLFPQPFWKGGYLVRKPVRQWTADISQSLAEARQDGEKVKLSAACNSLALLLLKCRNVGDSLALCQAQYTYFLETDPELSVQPWINIGRIFLRIGRQAESPGHFFMTQQFLPQDSFNVAGRNLDLPDADVLDVCRNVRIVDGLHCVLNCAGPLPAFSFLASIRNDNPGLVHEMEYYCALLTRDTARAAHAMDNLQARSDFLLVTYLKGLAAAYAGETSASMESVLTLAATLDSGNRRVDHLASVLHAINLIMKVLNPGLDIHAAIAGVPAIRDSLALLGDIELTRQLSPASVHADLPYCNAENSNLVAVFENALALLN